MTLSLLMFIHGLIFVALPFIAWVVFEIIEYRKEIVNLMKEWFR